MEEWKDGWSFSSNLPFFHSFLPPQKGKFQAEIGIRDPRSDKEVNTMSHPFLLIGSIISIVVIIRKKKFVGVKIPFAPFLVLGTFITIFFGEKLMNWYLKGLGF